MTLSKESISNSYPIKCHKSIFQVIWQSSPPVGILTAVADICQWVKPEIRSVQFVNGSFRPVDRLIHRKDLTQKNNSWENKFHSSNRWFSFVNKSFRQTLSNNYPCHWKDQKNDLFADPFLKSTYEKWRCELNSRNQTDSWMSHSDRFCDMDSLERSESKEQFWLKRVICSLILFSSQLMREVMMWFELWNQIVLFYEWIS